MRRETHYHTHCTKVNFQIERKAEITTNFSLKVKYKKSSIYSASSSFSVSCAMEFLDYDGAEEDLIVVVTSEDGTVFSEVAVNSVLLRMLSPWWKTKLTPNGFKEEIRDGRCTVIDDTPEVAVMALQIAKLRFHQQDLQKDADLNTIFKLWRLADMWQFGYLAKMCQSAMTHLLTQTDEASIREFISSAMDHSETIMEDVLLPLFLENPQLRTPTLYLAFDDQTMFTVAERAPIAGWLTASADYNDRLEHYVETLDDDEFVRFMVANPEARFQNLYALRSVECCMLLFAEAPLPLVSSMISLVLSSGWNRSQKEIAMLAVDFDRIVGHESKFFERVGEQLPSVTYIWQSLWRASNRQRANRFLSISYAAPWVVTFSDNYFSDAKKISAGPIEVVLRGRNDAHFFSSVPAYGVVRTHCTNNSWCWLESSYQCDVVQPGQQFLCGVNSVLVIYESDATVLHTSR